MLEENYTYDFDSLSNAPNSPDLDGKYLGKITADFATVADFLKDTSYQIRQRGFSKYPIFVSSKHAIDSGMLLVEPNRFGNQLFYFASYLELFTQQQLIATERIPVFEESYKNPDEFACLFVLDGDFAKFVFIPFPED